jgi:hypothetical protein
LVRTTRSSVELGPDDKIVCGGAVSGCDAIVEALAVKYRRIYIVVKSGFDFTPGAQDINVRNETVAQLADRGIAFWNGRSRRTADVVSHFQRLGKQVDVIRADG